MCALPQTYVIAAGNNNGDIYILNMTVQIYTFCTGGGGIVCLFVNKLSARTKAESVVSCEASDKNGVHSVINFNKK